MKKIDHEHLVHLEEIYETSKVSNPTLPYFLQYVISRNKENG